ncbi:MAG: hypothetical protein HY900_04310 [Deltaproteobacteria bacterium]|nr:hypothetical protein [Deltaproteobacteria bacterium]
MSNVVNLNQRGAQRPPGPRPKTADRRIRPTIAVDEVDLHETTPQVLAAIKEGPLGKEIYVHDTTLVRGRVNRRSGVVRLVRLGVDELRHVAARSARFVKTDRDGGETSVPPPAVIMRDVLVHPDSGFPVLERIAVCPFFDASGELIVEPGYHAESLTYLALPRDFEMPEVPLTPTREQVTEATAILASFVSGFPFAQRASKANWLSMALVPIIMHLFHGRSPLFAILANMPGTGKTLLINVTALAVTGQNARLMTFSRNEDEYRKKITSALIQGLNYIVLDNLVGKIDMPSMASDITNELIADRLLGSSKILELLNFAVRVVTGNNVLFSTELARRIVLIALDAGLENPWQRDLETFEHPDLVGWVRANRGAIIWALCVFVTNWLSKGKPSADVPPIGGFESWCAVTAGILAAATPEGQTAFLGNLAEFYRQGDEEGTEVRGLVARWWHRFGTDPVGVTDLFDMAVMGGVDLDLGSGNDRSQRIRFGRFLGSLNGRWVGALRISSCGSRRGSRMWRLFYPDAEAEAETAESGPSGETESEEGKKEE